MAKVVIVGSVNPELIFRFHPTTASKIRATAYVNQLGGTAYNVAAGLAKHLDSAHVLFEALVGSDVMGNVVHEMLGNVAHEMLWWRPATAVACILLPEGEPHQTIGAKEAAMSSPARIAQLKRVIAREHPSIILAAGLIPNEEWIATTLFTSASERTMRVFCPDVLACTNGALDAVIVYADLLVMNEEEARAFFHIEDIESDEATIRGRVSCDVVVTRADQGAVLFDRAGATLVVPTESVPSTNPVGAGDAFLAAFLAGLLRGAQRDAALRVAVAAGTQHVAGAPIALAQ